MGIRSMSPVPAALAAAALFAAGCETFYQPGYSSDSRNSEAARAAMNRQQAARDLAVLKAQGEANTIAVQQLDTRLDQLEQQTREGGATRAEIDALRRDLDQLRAEREQLRKQVVDDLSKEMSRLLAAQPASRSATSPKQSGYEHKVQAGQTLSEISKAYNRPMEAIKKANGMKDDRIHAGQVLFIPDGD